MKELTLPATVQSIEIAVEFVNSQLENADCPLRIMAQIDVAIDELFGNIALYAYDKGSGQATIRVEVTQEPSVIITFVDSGVPYNPLQRPDPDIAEDLEDRPLGGLGIFMVKKSMDDIAYEYKNGQNILRIKKYMENKNG